MSMDQRAGVWPVDEGGSSSSSAPAVPEDVEESELLKKLVSTTAPTATDREEHTASGHAFVVAECISIVSVEEKSRSQRLPSTMVT